MGKLGGWWRLWIAASVLWIAANVYDFLHTQRELPRPQVFYGRVGDLEGIGRSVTADRASECEIAGLGHRLKFERRVGFPEQAEQESGEANGADDPDFPNWPKDKTLKLPPSERQPYLIVRSICPRPGSLRDAIWLAFATPLLILVAAFTARWIWRGFRGNKGAM